MLWQRNSQAEVWLQLRLYAEEVWTALETSCHFHGDAQGERQDPDCSIVSLCSHSQRAGHCLHGFTRKHNGFQTRHVVIKRAKLKDKQKILKVAKEKQRVKHKGISRSLSAYSFTEMLQVRRQYKDIFKVIKLKNLQPMTLYPARLSFRTE